MTDKKISALIGAGGTGGHLFPAMAVAEQLDIQTKGSFYAEFVGNPQKIKSRVVPEAGYNFTPMPITGFKGIFSLDSLSLAFKILKSVKICRRIIKEHKINVVICTGAYISYPAGVAATKENVPLVLMESNLTPGKAIRMLSSKADLIITAFPDSERFYPAPLVSKIKPLGNPVRKSILNLPDQISARRSFNLDPDRFTVLIFGGSLGAKSINEAAENLILKSDSGNYQFIWQTGKNYQTNISERKNLWSSEFIDDMASAYSAADLVISRSGATTVSELCVVGKASVLVPYPAAANNEQELNAQYLTDKDAAILVYEDAIFESISDIVADLSTDEKKLKMMSDAAKSLSKPNASQDSAKAIIGLIDNL